MTDGKLRTESLKYNIILDVGEDGRVVWLSTRGDRESVRGKGGYYDLVLLYHGRYFGLYR